VAECVETETAATLLQEMGVQKLQGYFFSKPLQAAAFLSYLKTHAPKAASRHAA